MCRSEAQEKSRIPADVDSVALELGTLAGAEDFGVFATDGDAYVQVVRLNATRVRAEAVSNAFVGEEVLDAAGRERLAQLGWALEPGWHYTSTHDLVTLEQQIRLAEHLLKTLAEVYEWRGDETKVSREP